MSEPVRIQLVARRTGAHQGWTTVDREDADRVHVRRWQMTRFGYARSTIAGESTMLHRFVLGLGRRSVDPVEVDHINRDRLDNRRSNLRIGTRALNNQNMSPRPNTTSRHRGVAVDPRTRTRPYRVRVCVGGVTHNLGYFADELEAAQVAADFRREHMPFSEEASDFSTAPAATALDGSFRGGRRRSVDHE